MNMQSNFQATKNRKPLKSELLIDFEEKQDRQNKRKKHDRKKGREQKRNY